MKFLNPCISTFCVECKAPNPPDWSTGNKSLDSFIMKSWKDILVIADGYIQWIEFCQLVNIQEMPLLEYGCTHMADWIGQMKDGSKTTRVTLKKIVDGFNSHLFNFSQVIFCSKQCKYVLYYC